MEHTAARHGASFWHREHFASSSRCGRCQHRCSLCTVVACAARRKGKAATLPHTSSIALQMVHTGAAASGAAQSKQAGTTAAYGRLDGRPRARAQCATVECHDFSPLHRTWSTGCVQQRRQQLPASGVTASRRSRLCCRSCGRSRLCRASLGHQDHLCVPRCHDLQQLAPAPQHVRHNCRAAQRA